MTRPAAQGPDYQPVPESVSELVEDENPNRWLARATDHGLDAAGPMVWGIRSPERAYAWVVCETRRDGGPREPVLEGLVKQLWATRGVDPRGRTAWTSLETPEPLHPESGTEAFERRKRRVRDRWADRSPQAIREEIQRQGQRDPTRRHVMAGLHAALQMADAEEVPA